MDIEYLLALQNARAGVPNVIEQGMLWFSYIADGPVLVALALVVYWCIDKRAGQLASCAFVTGNFVCQFLKNLLCVYRPWIRDTRVMPVADAIEGAGGYSFPSGHTTGATTVFGSLAWSAWHEWRTRRAQRTRRTAHSEGTGQAGQTGQAGKTQSAKHARQAEHIRNRAHTPQPWLVVVSVLCVLSIVIIAFSRNFLGVHTPQDVLVGLGIALLCIALAHVFFAWMDRLDTQTPRHRADIATVVVVWVVCVGSLAVLAIKPYPLDYVESELLVDPARMLKGSYEAAGAFMGMALGWLLERRFVGFSTYGLRGVQRAARACVGVGVVGLTYIAGEVIFEMLLPYHLAKCATMLVLCVMALYVVPLIFKQSGALFGGNNGKSTPNCL